jgi:asparagine synthase (glutamine-hydrolysing)
MGALAGILRLDDQPVMARELDKILEPARYRGPDGVGRWSENGFAMAHAALWTCPSDEGVVQPIAGPRHVVLFEGRIDNRAALAETLGPDADALSDAACFARLYGVLGREALSAVIGDFALAVWDRNVKELLLARDVLGRRSLFYAVTPRAIVFASEVKQLLHHPLVGRQPNEAVVAEHLAACLVTVPETLYDGILRIPPAHCAVIKNGKITLKRFWDIDPNRELRLPAREGYAELVRDTLATVVSAQSRSLTPVAAYLSGGVDSSTVVAFARHVGVQHFSAHSLTFPGRDCDETAFIDDVVHWTGVASHRHPYAGPPTHPFASASEDQELPHYPNTIMHTSLFSELQRRGTRVIFSGEGGDELFSGSFAIVADLLRNGHLFAAWQTVRDDARIPGFLYPSLPLFRFGVWPLLPRTLRERLRALRRRARPARHAYLDPAFLARTHFWERVDQSFVASERFHSHAHREQANGIWNAWAAQGNESGERLLASHHLEQRNPLFDRRLIELAFALPETQKRAGQNHKVVLRDAGIGLLPESVQKRQDKADFSVIYVDALNALSPAWFEDLAIARLGWVSQPEVSALYRRYRASPNPALSHCLLRLWMIASIEAWFRAVFVREGLLHAA